MAVSFHLKELQLKGEKKIKLNLVVVGEIIDSWMGKKGRKSKVFDKTEINKAYGFEDGTWSAYVMFVYLKADKNFALLLKSWLELFVAPWRISLGNVVFGKGQKLLSSDFLHSSGAIKV